MAYPPQLPSAAPAPAAAASALRGRRPGFTLLEIWVGLLLVVAVTAISLAVLRGRTKTAIYRRNRDLLLADLRALQQGSLVGKTVPVCTIGRLKKICPVDGSCSCSEEVPRGGYGAFVVLCGSTASPCAYYLFADLDGDANYDYRGSYGVSDELLSGGRKTFEAGVTVTRLEPTFQGCSNGGDTVFTVTFQPYTGSVTLKGNSVCAGYQGAARVRETVQIGPNSSGVQVNLLRGSGGIQEETPDTLP